MKKLHTLISASTCLLVSVTAFAGGNPGALDEQRIAEETKTELTTGAINGALYTIAKPPDWRGKLLLIAHGLRFEDRELDASLNIKSPVLANLLADGWMVAISSYRRNGLIVMDAIEDLDLLREHIVSTFGQPGRTLLLGSSLGGAIGTIIGETNPQDYDGIIAVGAALRVLETEEPYELSHEPKMPILFLTNQSELEYPEQYVKQAQSAAVPPLLWPVARDGHVNVNDAEREAAIRALDHFLDTGDIERVKDGTIKGTAHQSTAEFTDQGAVSSITSVSRVYGNFFTGFVEADLSQLGITRGQALRLKTQDQEISVLWGTNYRDVQQGEWVALISAEGNLMVARNTENACQSINCNIGDRLLLSPALSD